MGSDDYITTSRRQSEEVRSARLEARRLRLEHDAAAANEAALAAVRPLAATKVMPTSAPSAASESIPVGEPSAATADSTGLTTPVLVKPTSLKAFTSSTPVPEYLSAPQHHVTVSEDVQPDLETPPDARFTKIRNSINDRLKRHLTPSHFIVFSEIYRQTIGRQKSAGWFRIPDVQRACGLGSDKTVRLAYRALEDAKLIRVQWPQRHGNPKGLYIEVLAVERAIDRLERRAEKADQLRYRSTGVPEPSVPEYPGVQYSGTAVENTGLMHERTWLKDISSKTSPAGDGGDGRRAAAAEQLTGYGVTPATAPMLVSTLSHDDIELLPFLLARLEASIATGRVLNPAGLLRTWILDFETWRPELERLMCADQELTSPDNEPPTAIMLRAWAHEFGPSRAREMARDAGLNNDEISSALGQEL